MDEFEQRECLLYAKGILGSLQASSRVNKELESWISDFGTFLGVKLPKKDKGAGDRKRFSQIQEVFGKALGKLEDAAPGNLEANLRQLQRLTGIDDAERRIVGLFARYRFFMAVEKLVDLAKEAKGLRRYLHYEPTLVAPILGIDPQQAMEFLRPGGKLATSGIFSVDTLGHISLLDRLSSSLFATTKDDQAMIERLIGTPTKPHLEWDDYLHIEEERDHLERILRGALKSNERGVNIFIYGPPGTGKTEFCKTLADRVGSHLYAMGEVDDWGGQPSADERVSSLQLAQRILRKSQGSILLFDEMEELFYSNGYPKDSRVFLLRLLEDSHIPTLWTANRLDPFEPAVLRRMTFALELKVPPLSARTSVWKRELKRMDLDVSNEEAEELARDFEAAPALAASAARSARLSGGGLKDARRAISSIAKAIRGGRSLPPKVFSEDRFDLALTNADTDLEALVSQLKSQGGIQPFSMLAHGPPGSGKSQFARYLAKSLDLPVVVKRGSDLLSKWVGETEQLIAASFEEANERKALLVFDEIDGMIGERDSGAPDWVITKVNEMLTWMESHPLPLVATTNFLERIDQAALRRFTFKVGFDYLTPEMAKKAFEVHFGRKAPSKLDAIVNLTPADFAVAARKAEILGIAEDDDEVLALIRVESEVKRDSRPSIGFNGGR